MSNQNNNAIDKNPANHANKKQLTVSKQQKVVGMLEQMKKQMALAMPKHISVDRMARIALTEFRKNPKLQECEPLSFLAAVMLCGQLGVEVGPLGHAYLIPYGRECTFILGYKGMIDLARRSGQIISLTAHTVYENDKFNYAYGLDDKVEHVPALNDRGKLIAVYAIAKLKGGGHQFEVLSKEEIDKIRETSKAKNSGPWVGHYDEMAKKTAIRRLFKYLPVSIEMQKAMAYEDDAEDKNANVIEMSKEAAQEGSEDAVAEFWAAATTETVDKETGEVKTQAEAVADLI